jgi:acetolactate synthase-1/2/3 large subunit
VNGSPAPDGTVAAAFPDMLWALGVAHMRGVPGGPVAPLYHMLEDHRKFRCVTCRTEAGAGFQAVGAWLATGRPSLLVTTSGPGMLGTRQPLELAKREGAQIVMVSPCTPSYQRGRRMPQGSEEFVSADYHTPGLLFDLVVQLELADELAPLSAGLSAGLSRPEGFLAHVLFPTDLLLKPAVTPTVPCRRAARLLPDAATLDEVIAHFAGHRFFVVVGSGAHDHAQALRRFVDRTGAPVVATPGGKGVIDDRSPSMFGGSGIGGHRSALDRLEDYGPAYALVLGTTLSGASASAELVGIPRHGLIHVDRRAAAVGAAWEVPTLAVQSDIGAFLDAVLARETELVRRPLPPGDSPLPAGPPEGDAGGDGVRPRALMDAVQRAVLDGSDAPLWVDVGSVFPWACELLAVPDPGRWFLETGYGCMGGAFAGSVGAAIATGRKTVTLAGDWAADAGWPELRTAVDNDASIVWIVFDNAGGQMVIDGDATNWGRRAPSARFRPGDLAAAARALGARGISVTHERDLGAALQAAMASPGPCLVDVKVRTDQMPSYGTRLATLRPASAT